jgi:hypothetical protein
LPSGWIFGVTEWPKLIQNCNNKKL